MSLSPREPVIVSFDPLDIATCVGEDNREMIASDGGQAVAPPIVQTSLFSYPSFGSLLDGLAAEHQHHVYTRGQNPTVEILERKLATLERGEACKCFASGMAAISATFFGLLEAGDHILFVNQIYGPTLQLANELRRFGIDHDLVSTPDIEAIEQALRPETRLIWFENPGTMLFRTFDVAPLVELARRRGILTAMDNTWATPLFQKPLVLGVDLVMHTLSKYLSGHSDVVAGALVGPASLLEKIFFRSFMLLGGILAPFDAWLALRGLRTLPIRLRQHEASGLETARFLAQHPAVRRVYHPGLEGDSRSLTGYPGLFSFELADGSFDDVQRLIDRLQVFRIGVSWGGVESLVISPNRGTNSEQLKRQGIPPGLVRLSVGLEGSSVLIRDLGQALSTHHD